MYIQEKLNMCKFPFKACVQKSVQNFFAKIWYLNDKELSAFFKFSIKKYVP